MAGGTSTALPPLAEAAAANCGAWATTGSTAPFAFAQEEPAAVGAVVVNAQHVAQVELVSGQQVGQRVDHVAFDGPLQVARAVAR
jgi:hypothetical protein